jgi:hypothetical protein
MSFFTPSALKKSLFFYLVLILLAGCDPEDPAADELNSGNGNPLAGRGGSSDGRSSSESVVKLKAKVIMLVGDVHYENCEAKIIVKGFDQNGVQNYSEDFAYSGPEDTLSISRKSASYTMALNIWDKTYNEYDNDRKISQDKLWESRMDGPTPVTYSFGRQVTPKKIKRTERFFLDSKGGESLTEGGGGNRTDYEYLSNGQVSTIKYYTLTTEGAALQSWKEFVYVNNVLERIKSFSVYNNQNSPTNEYIYTNGGKYESGTINVISPASRNGTPTTLRTTVNVTFDHPKVDARYTYRYDVDGYSFTEVFSVTAPWESITSSRSTRPYNVSPYDVCNEGQFTHDKNINPLRHLGYLDAYMENFSANNTLTESINYIACYFPQLIPLHYEYTYQDGYPVTQVTHYRGGGFRRSRTYYYYY